MHMIAAETADQNDAFGYREAVVTICSLYCQTFHHPWNSTATV